MNLLNLVHSYSLKMCVKYFFNNERRRARWSTPVFLPGEPHGQRSLEGYGPQGCNELDMTEAT